MLLENIKTNNNASWHCWYLFLRSTCFDV